MTYPSVLWFQLLSHILSFLPVRNLRRVRFVSKMWDAEAKKLLRKKGQIILNLAHGWRNNGIRMSNGSSLLLRYSHEMSQTPIWNWSFKLPSFLDVMPGGVPQPRLISDLTSFFSKDFSHHVRKLQLDGEIGSKTDFEIRMRILERVQGTLEELDFRVHWGLDHGLPQQCKFPGDIRLNKLKRFVLQGSSQIALPWLEEGLIPRITRVTEIYVPESEFLGRPLLEKLSCFSNLEKIELETATPDVVTYLRQGLQKGLKSFKLYQFQGMTPEAVSNFGELLRVHANTLESLTLHLPQVLNSNLCFEFPVLPRLKELDIGFARSYRNTPFGASISFCEPLGKINYSEHLPSLEYLTVWPWANYGSANSSLPSDHVSWRKREVAGIRRLWEKYALRFDIFFPPHGQGGASQVCKTLKVLDIPFQNYYGNPTHKNAIFPRAPELARMFPNVSNKWTTDARLAPYDHATPE